MSAPRIVKKQVAVGKAYATLFGSPDGKLVLIDLMKRAKLLEIGVDDGAFDNGRRSIVTEIMAACRYDWGRLLELSQEPVEEYGGEA